MKKKLVMVIASMVFSLPLAFAQQTGGANPQSSSDNEFVTKAAGGGLAEVQLGQLAAQKASNPDVKQFAQKMVDDHSRANDELKNVASQKNVTLPTDLPPEEQQLRDRLQNMSGQEFDRTYMRHMVQDHAKDVAEFQREATRGQDNDVKQFASKTLPVLQQHLKMARQVAGKVGASGARSSEGKTGASDQQR